MRRTSASSCARTTGRSDWKRRWRTSRMLRRAHALAAEIVVVDNNSRDDTKLVVSRAARASTIPVRYVFEPRTGACLSPAIADCRKPDGQHRRVHRRRLRRRSRMDRRALRRIRGRPGRGHRRRPRRPVLAGRSAGVDPSRSPSASATRMRRRSTARHGLQPRGSARRGRAHRRVRSGLRRKQRRRRGRHRIRLPRVRATARHRVHTRRASAAQSRPRTEWRVARAAHEAMSGARVRSSANMSSDADRTILSACVVGDSRPHRRRPQSTVAPRDPRRTRVRSDPLRADARETRPAVIFRVRGASTAGGTESSSKRTTETARGFGVLARGVTGTSGDA